MVLTEGNKAKLVHIGVIHFNKRIHLSHCDHCHSLIGTA